MNFDFSEAEKQFHSALESTIAEVMDRKQQKTGDLAHHQNFFRNCQNVLAGIGYLDLGLRSSANSPGSTLHLMACQERLAAASPAVYLTVEMSSRMFGRILHRWGTQAQKDMLLSALTSGALLGAVAISENAMNVTNDPLTTVGIEKDNHIQLSGIKNYVINGPVANWIAVVGQLQDRPAVFLVDTHASGIVVHETLSTMGYEDVAIAGIALDHCHVPKEMVIVPPEETALIASLQRWENQILIAASLGMMKAAIDEAKAFANAHHSGGKPVVAYQEVAFKLAEMLTFYQTSQLLAYRAAWTSDTDERERDTLTLCTKVFCSESAEKVASQALQILSGTGFKKGNKAECAYRCAKYTQIAGTSTEIARVMIGDEVLGYR